MGSDVEARLVGLHEVERLALGSVGVERILGAANIVSLHKVDTSDAATVDLAEVNVVLDGSAKDERLEAVGLAIVWLLLDEDSVVGSDSEGVGVTRASLTVATVLPVLGVGGAVNVDVDAVVCEGGCGQNCSCKDLHLK